ncbi:hypothetical protein AOLI_G00218850 [Acnodon oligacanthus]
MILALCRWSFPHLSSQFKAVKCSEKDGNLVLSSDTLYHAFPPPLSSLTSLSAEAQEGQVKTRKLNPRNYEARRAGNAVRLYLNTLYGSSSRLYSVTKIHKARTKDMGEAGMKYFLKVSVESWSDESSEWRGSVEVLYPRGETQAPPQVQGSWGGLPQLNISDKEQEFYQRYSAADSAVSGKDIPDSYGNIDPEMKPFWHLARVAASFVMLNESNENTLYNMAQVAKITQLETQDDQLRFELEVLLHDMVSEEG